MKEYEIMKEIFNGCAGENYRAGCEITELELTDPMSYVKDQYKLEKDMEYVTSEKNGSLVIEASHPCGIKHRYTFSEF